MRRPLLPLAVAAAIAAAVLAPVALLAQVSSWCSVAASSYADSVLNPPKGEDTEFFVSTGGVPNLAFVLDNSTSMLRLAPDGAERSWGSFERPGNAVAGAGYGCTNAYGNARVFNSPCGTTVLDGGRYNQPNPIAGGPQPPDYAEAKTAAGQYCPRMVSGNQPPATDRPGFDPDFYPDFFVKNRVYKDNNTDALATWSWTTTGATPQAEASIADFCARWSADAARQGSCTACMRDQGYWFDGSYEAAFFGRACRDTSECSTRGEGTCVRGGVEWSGATAEGQCRRPNVYLSGNFLNFNPPKFVMARKVLKDVLMSVRRVRLALAVFNDTDTGGALISELNPACNMFGSPSSFDSNRGAVMNQINNTNSVRFEIPQPGNQPPRGRNTPLSETLLNVGQYYRTAALPWFSGSYGVAAWNEKAANNRSVCFSCQASAVLMITDGLPTRDGGTAAQRTIPGPEYAAAPMTLAVANTAGSYAGMGGYNITEISSADCPACDTWAEAADTTLTEPCNSNQLSGACDDAQLPVKSYLPKVAWYLKNVDFRVNTETGADGFAFDRKQSLTTYTIGLGTRGAATEILKHTAEAGGGLFNGGSGAEVTDARTLRDAIMRVLEDVNTRSTSFGSASLSTLQIATTQGVLVPRFEPSRSAHWDGHLYAFDLYSEFTAVDAAGRPTCTPAAVGTSGPANGDYDCDGKCSSVFLKDADGHFIQEDGTGAFKKSLNVDRAACGNGSRCTGGDCAGPNPNAPARPFWDAGSKLAPVKTTTNPDTGITTQGPNPDFAPELAWDRRNIYTVIDDAPQDGKFTSTDTVLNLRTATSDAAVASLAPYLNLSSRSCLNVAQRLTSLGNPAGATVQAQVAAGNFLPCARIVLAFVRGADVFNERLGDPACTNYPSATNPAGTYCTRKYQLGDVFHSSPIEVWPPLASDGFACPRSLSSQCLTSLFSNSIPNPSTATPRNANAYDDYAKSARYKSRPKFALVGANDGMLHAIQIERFLSDGTTPNPHAGKELWAFIPPDLLPKLRLLLESTHHFYVDGTAMVRDVWIDGVPNALGAPAAAADDVRQGSEFHTVAIVGERRGGTHYFALDVTDAYPGSAANPQPKFMWLYPQPNDPEQLQFGETYVEFVPKPPPIGPVRLDRGPAPAGGCGDLGFFSGPGGNRCFEERYVVFLSGGFDPQHTKGRGVHMVDVASGEEIWDFAQQPGTAGTPCLETSDPRCHLNYPVAATVAMMMWGNQPTYTIGEARAGYFDTATFGDTGGQLWVLRFAEPGQVEGGGRWTPGGGRKVQNWYGARIFQSGKTATTPECGLDYCGPTTALTGGGSPFFYITSNVALSVNSQYRVLAGTGDRFNLLDPVGGVCGPDNLRACLQKGCTVRLQDPAGNPGAVYGVETLLGTQSYEMSGTAQCTATPTNDFTFTATPPTAGGTCGTVTQKIDGLVIECPQAITCSGAAGGEATAKRVALTCNGRSCDPAAGNDLGSPIDLKGNPDKLNWFYSVRVFDSAAPRGVFRTPAEAIAYDRARLTEANLKNVNAYDTSPVPANLASPDSPGWSYYFDHGESRTSGAVAITVNGLSHNIYRTDERNASVSAVEQGCSFWNTMQTATPVGALDAATECPINSPCKAGRAQVSYLYGASPGTGGQCLYVEGALRRSQRNETLVPPHIGKLVAYVAGGQVAFGLTSVRVPQGGANISLGEAKDLATQIEWLPVDPDMHRCRHSPRTNADGTPASGPAAADCR